MDLQFLKVGHSKLRHLKNHLKRKQRLVSQYVALIFLVIHLRCWKTTRYSPHGGLAIYLGIIPWQKSKKKSTISSYILGL